MLWQCRISRTPIMCIIQSPKLLKASQGQLFILSTVLFILCAVGRHIFVV